MFIKGAIADHNPCPMNRLMNMNIIGKARKLGRKLKSSLQYFMCELAMYISTASFDFQIGH